MFASLIRRTLRNLALSGRATLRSSRPRFRCRPRSRVRPNAATDERMSAMLRVGKLTDASGEQQLIKVKNLSAGGMMAIVNHAPQVGDQRPCRAVVAEDSRRRSSGLRDDIGRPQVRPECRSRRAPCRAQAAARLPRAPAAAARFACKASVRVGKVYYTVDVHDISLGGMKVEPIEEYCVGKKVVVVVESLRPIKGEVRWYSDRRAGIVFDKPLDFDELAEWVGKRLELASLKASYQKS